MEDKDLKSTLEQILLSLNESKETLQTILMAIYDLDIESADNERVVNGLKTICKLLKEISAKQRPSDHIKGVIYRTNEQ